MTIEVVKPGMSSTFQDLGRSGHQHLGVPVAGAMDEVAHRVANLLVGNDESEATLEVTLIGPSLRFERPATIAICGADLDATLTVSKRAGQPVPSWMPVDIPAGATLRFGARRSGARGYIALRGGFDLPAVMGSRSTHVRSETGGLEGRALRAGDSLRPTERASHAAGVLGVELGRCLWRVQPSPSTVPIRIVEGREWQAYTPKSKATLLTQSWRIGTQSDRMAFRLEAESPDIVLARVDDTEILSEAVAFGTVQVPADGRPIVLMADRQSTGGYARIAQVASVDLPRLAQKMPGESVRFTMVSLDEAERLLLQRDARMQDLRVALGRP